MYWWRKTILPAKTLWNKVRILSAVLLWLSPLALVPSTAGKTTAQDVLDQARKTFDALFGFRAELTESFRWQLAETSTESRGTMTYRKDDHFRLEFPTQLVIVDGKYLWRYSPDTGQLLIETYSDDSGVILPKQLLTGLSAHWELQNTQDAAARDSVGYKLELTPKDQNSAFRRVTVWVDPAKWLVRQAIVDDAQGNQTIYRIDRIELNPVLPDSLFKVTVPEGTETIDLR